MFQAAAAGTQPAPSQYLVPSTPVVEMRISVHLRPESDASAVPSILESALSAGAEGVVISTSGAVASTMNLRET